MEFLTNFARSLQQAQATPSKDVTKDSQNPVVEEPQPAFPVFKIPLRPSTVHNIKTAPPSEVVHIKTPALIQKRILAPKPAGILKNSPKSTYITAEVINKLKDPVKSIKIDLPSKKRIVVEPSVLPPRKSTPISPHKTPSKPVLPPPTPSSNSEHPLSLALKDTTAAYTTHLLTYLPALLRKHTTTLASALVSARSTSASYIKDYDAAATPLLLPLSESGLVITRDRGHPEERKIQTTIGDQMALFEKTVRADEARLSELKKHWDTVEKEIKALGREMRDERVEGGFAAEMAKCEAEFGKRTAELVKRHEIECRRLAAEVKLFEQANEKKQAEFQRQIMALMVMNDDDDDDEDELADGNDNIEDDMDEDD